MKIKKLLIILAIMIASICLLSISNKVNAYTITDDGEYALVLVQSLLGDEDIDGMAAKVIRFNVDSQDEVFKIYELANGVQAFNGKNVFSHWKASKDGIDDEVTAANFTSNGSVWADRYTEIKYTKGLMVSPVFSDAALKGTGTYYITLDGFAGKVEGKNKMRITVDANSFSGYDLSKLTVTRDGCTFCGWGYNGQIVTSIDKSFFSNSDAVELTATYKENNFDVDGDRILNLMGNGGTIDGSTVLQCNYLGGDNSGTSMSVFQYVPERAGYKFSGWNTKIDGSGKTVNYIYWRAWSQDGSDEYEKSDLDETTGMYTHVILYACWEKVLEPEDSKNVIESSSGIKGSVTFVDEIAGEYRLDIQEVEVAQEWADQGIKFIADIRVLWGDDVVEINGIKMKIKIALPDDLKGFDSYEVVYLLRGKIRDRLPATVEDGYLVFETTHLSEYGIIAKNVENDNTGKTEEEPKSNEEENEMVEKDETAEKNKAHNPKTGDDILMYVGIGFVSIAGLAICRRRFQRK